MPSPDSRPLVEALPTPAQVRGRLAQAQHEVVLLRHLLKLSERAEHYRRAESAEAAPSANRVA